MINVQSLVHIKSCHQFPILIAFLSFSFFLGLFFRFLFFFLICIGLVNDFQRTILWNEIRTFWVMIDGEENLLGIHWVNILSDWKSFHSEGCYLPFFNCFFDFFEESEEVEVDVIFVVSFEVSNELMERVLYLTQNHRVLVIRNVPIVSSPQFENVIVNLQVKHVNQFDIGLRKLFVGLVDHFSHHVIQEIHAMV